MLEQISRGGGRTAIALAINEDAARQWHHYLWRLGEASLINAVVDDAPAQKGRVVLNVKGGRYKWRREI